MSDLGIKFYPQYCGDDIIDKMFDIREKFIEQEQRGTTFGDELAAQQESDESDNADDSTDTESNINKHREVNLIHLSSVVYYPWLANMMNSVCVDANNHFQFALNGMNQFDFLRYEVGDYYDWHKDTNIHKAGFEDDQSRHRKLTCIIQMSDDGDYVGGDLEFNHDWKDQAKNEDWNAQLKEQIRGKGTIIVFPSYLEHRVTPVTEGVRYAVASWCSGPAWR